jgi:hypothetical protein
MQWQALGQKYSTPGLHGRNFACPAIAVRMGNAQLQNVIG